MKQRVFEKYVGEVTDSIRETLFSKNISYGGSAVKEEGIFSKASVIDRLCMRIDDKLKRIEALGFTGYGEDNLLDLIGYFIILRAYTAYDKDSRLQPTVSESNQPSAREIFGGERILKKSPHKSILEEAPLRFEKTGESLRPIKAGL